MLKKFSTAYFLLALAYSLGMWVPMLGLNDLSDAASNEILFSQESLSKIFFNMKWNDQSPLYFFILHFWYKIFDYRPLWFYLLDLFFVILTGYSMYMLTQIITKKEGVSLFTALLFIISPLATWLVFSGRMYPIVLFLSTFSIVYFLKFLKERDAANAAKFIILQVLLIYTHFLGFIITGLFFLWWLLIETHRMLACKNNAAISLSHLSKYNTLLITASIIQILTLPQLLRLGALISNPPKASKEWSVSSTIGEFINAVINFNLLCAPWPFSLHLYQKELRDCFLCIVILLGIRGFYFVTREVKCLALIFVPLSLSALFLLTSSLDFRNRYFLYVAPIIFLLIGIGGFYDSSVSNKIHRTLMRGTRYSGMLFVAFVFLLLSKEGVQIRQPEYSRIMRQIEKLKIQNPSVYTSVRYAQGIPEVVGKRLQLKTPFYPVSSLNTSTREIFEKEVENDRNFIFFFHGDKNGEDKEYREKLLEKKKYNTILFDSSGLKAKIFTKKDPLTIKKRLLNYSKIQTPVHDKAVVEWAITSMKTKAPITSGVHPRLFTARINQENGTTVSPTFLSTQNGFHPEWNYVGLYWEKIKYIDMISSGIKKDVFFAHPIQNSTLVVAFPDVTFDEWLQVVHTMPVENQGYQKAYISVYVGNTEVSKFISINRVGWLSKEIDTFKWKNKTEPLVFLVTCDKQRFAHFGFNFKTFTDKPKKVVSMSSTRG